MLNQRSSITLSVLHCFSLGFRVFALSLIVFSVFSAEAAPTPINIDFADSDGSLVFSITGDGAVIKREQIQLSLSDERKTLLKIEVEGASTERGKYWIKSFSDSKSDPDVKGIMVRKDKNADKVQVRVRYKKRIEHSKREQITLEEIPNGVKVTAPRAYDDKGSNDNTSSAVSNTPKPSLDPKLSKISSLSSSLSDDKEVVKPGVDRPSVFDRGTPVAPLPKMEKLRPTGLVSSNLGEDLGSAPAPVAVEAIPQEEIGEPNQTDSNLPKEIGEFKTAKDIASDRMLSLDVPKPTPAPSTPDTLVGSKSPFDLDELTNLSAYIVLFLLLLWGASYFFKKGKALEGHDQGSSIKVLSQKVVGVSPRQRIMVIETMGHTIVVGACERGGLSHIAHLSTPQGHVSGSSPSYDHYTPNDRRSNLDALSSFGGRDQYYADDGYPLDESSYQRSEPVAEAGVTYEENTFVGEDEVFTAELPSVGDQAPMMDPMTGADSYTHEPVQGIDQFADHHLNSLSSPESASSGLSTLEGAEDDVNMKPGDLLQWIQKLNGTKG